MSTIIQADPEALAPLVERIVSQTLDRLGDERERLGSRLAYPLSEAAKLLGVRAHVLRDARRRGEIRGRVIGRKLLFTRGELMRFLRGGDEESTNVR
jgi:hypothetical protein